MSSWGTAGGKSPLARDPRARAQSPHPQTVHGHALTQLGPAPTYRPWSGTSRGDRDFSLVHPFSQPRTHGAADLATFLSDHNRFKFPNDIQQRQRSSPWRLAAATGGAAKGRPLDRSRPQR